MDEENGSTPTLPVVNEAPAAAPAPARASRFGILAALVAVIALVVAGFALWRMFQLERGAGSSETALRSELTDRIEDLSRVSDQRKRDLESLRTRLADLDGVNKSLREELLSLGERSRHLEDAVANLAEQRLTGRDALALNEAEFLLQQADERLALFHDPAAALAAYRLADSALAAAEDPVFAGVRQTIGAEISALEAAKPLETHATLTELERVRGQLAALPAKPRSVEDRTASSSRLMAVLEQFVRVTHDEGTTPGSRDIELARALAAIDLRAAESALLARDPDAYKGALGRVRTEIGEGFDANAAPTRAALATIDRLSSQPLAPKLPELGSALRELRNLRATRALATPHATAKAGNEAGT